MSTAPECPRCACRDPRGALAHALLADLAGDDWDRALDRGLLQAETCPACDAACGVRLIEQRDARLRALAARERYRTREARLARRAQERAARRADAAKQPSALPPAAAAALARARARAHKP